MVLKSVGSPFKKLRSFGSTSKVSPTENTAPNSMPTNVVLQPLAHTKAEMPSLVPTEIKAVFLIVFGPALFYLFVSDTRVLDFVFFVGGILLAFFTIPICVKKRELEYKKLTKAQIDAEFKRGSYIYFFAFVVMVFLVVLVILGVTLGTSIPTNAPTGSILGDLSNTATGRAIRYLSFSYFVVGLFFTISIFSFLLPKPE